MAYGKQIDRLRSVMVADFMQRISGADAETLHDIVDDLLVSMTIENLESILENWPKNWPTSVAPKNN